jgi:Ornithine cyclodeaminase/mu-crystallin family
MSRSGSGRNCSGGRLQSRADRRGTYAARRRCGRRSRICCILSRRSCRASSGRVAVRRAAWRLPYQVWLLKVERYLHREDCHRLLEKSGARSSIQQWHCPRLQSENRRALQHLQDEGWLTDIRTAAAGAVAARYLAPPNITCIGILGSGNQATLQLDYLRHVTTCRRARSVQVQGFEIEAVSSIAEVASSCQLIVTTTASREPLLHAHHLLPGTHVSAVGADGGGKQELSPDIFARAAIRAVDSRLQAALYGDASAALRQGLIRLEDLVELGQIVANPCAYQRKPEDVTLVDLTGVALQDIAVANLALAALNKDISNASKSRG